MVYVAAEKVVACVIDFFLFSSCASLSVDVGLREKNATFNGNKSTLRRHPHFYHFNVKQQCFSVLFVS